MKRVLNIFFIFFSIVLLISCSNNTTSPEDTAPKNGIDLKYSGVWEGTYNKKFSIDQTGFLITSVSSSSGSKPMIIPIENIERLSNNEYKIVYEQSLPKGKIDAVIKFNSDTKAHIEGVMYNYFAQKDITINEDLIKKVQVGVNNQYAGVWKGTKVQSYELKINTDGSIEHTTMTGGNPIKFKIPANKIIKYDDKRYETYGYYYLDKNNDKYNEAVCNIDLNFSDANNCKFSFKFHYKRGGR